MRGACNGYGARAYLTSNDGGLVCVQAKEKATGRVVALKRVKMENEQNGFPVTSIREINILLNFHHPNIVNVEEVLVHPR